ncbi:MAG: CAAD domain-containing protein [Coleofasciculaceae cyanobacterium]
MQTETETIKTVVNNEPRGEIVPATTSSNSSPDQAWQEWVQPVSEFLSKLPDYVGGFFQSYQQPLITLALILSGVITVKVTLAVLDALNDIPLLAPVFELVGIGYTAWFVYRYLLKVETRKELGAELEALKGQVVGK